MDYFYYALVAGNDVMVNDIGKCQEECGKGEWVEKCCASVTMFRERD